MDKLNKRREGTTDFEQAKALFKAGYRIKIREEERDMSPKGEYGRFTADVTVTAIMDGSGAWEVAQVIDNDIELLLRLLVQLPEWGCTDNEEYADPLAVFNHIRDLTLEE